MIIPGATCECCGGTEAVENYFRYQFDDSDSMLLCSYCYAACPHDNISERWRTLPPADPMVRAIQQANQECKL